MPASSPRRMRLARRFAPARPSGKVGRIEDTMARSERLFTLLQVLRRHRRPVSGRVLADELGISLRTLYRDIASLQGQGAAIEGEPGLGYVLRPGCMLPPLMSSEEEIEALALGSQWVARRALQPLAQVGRQHGRD